MHRTNGALHKVAKSWGKINTQHCFLIGVLSWLCRKAGEIPVAEKTALRVLSLPMHPYLTEQENSPLCKPWRRQPMGLTDMTRTNE